MGIPRAAFLYVISTIILAAAILFFINSVWQIGSLVNELWMPLLIFVAISFFAQIYEVSLVFNRTVSTSVAVFMAVVLLGSIPLAVGVMALSTFLAEFLLRVNLLRTDAVRFAFVVFFNTAQLTLASFAAGAVYVLLGGHGVIPGGHIISDPNSVILIIAAIGAFFSFSIINTALVSGLTSLIAKTNFGYHLRFNFQFLMVQILSLGVLGVLIAEVYSYAPVNIVLVLIPMALVHVSLRNYMKLRQEAQKTFENVANMLAERDPYTYEHSEQVEGLAEQVARVMHFSQDEIADIKAGALIHDIGKLAVPDRILLKPGPLTPEERAEMEKHPVIGAELLKNLEIYKNIVEIVRHEHEKWDGTGYPDGLKGEEIPLGARIIAAADIYNALTTDRPYRKAYSHEKAIDIMKDMHGTHLDPDVLDALFRVLGVLEDEPQPMMERVLATATPFTPVLIVLLILILHIATGASSSNIIDSVQALP